VLLWLQQLACCGWQSLFLYIASRKLLLTNNHSSIIGQVLKSVKSQWIFMPAEVNLRTFMYSVHSYVYVHSWDLLKEHNPVHNKDLFMQWLPNSIPWNSRELKCILSSEILSSATHTYETAYLCSIICMSQLILCFKCVSSCMKSFKEICYNKSPSFLSRNISCLWVLSTSVYRLLRTLVHSISYPLPYLPIFSSYFSVFLSSCFLEDSKIVHSLVSLHLLFLICDQPI